VVPVHTDEGIIGEGETCFTPEATRSFIHELAGRFFLAATRSRSFQTDAGALACELLVEGITGMKIWPFDVSAQQKGGIGIEHIDLQAGLEPVRKIRAAVGDAMEMMIEGHGFRTLPAAVKIARALEEYNPAWIEDLILADDPTALGALCRATPIPVLASGYLMTRWEFRQVLDARGADILMTDPCLVRRHHRSPEDDVVNRPGVTVVASDL
jgi:L-alanine-DL-glutamate epimerase-like enolase superfamily enzyme